VEAQVKAVPAPELLARLRQESLQGAEPYNSLAYREVLRRGADISAELAASISEANRSSVLALLALRAVDRRRYTLLSDSLAVAILIDALKSSETFNIWGLPHLYWEDAAKAVIELGGAARPPLIQLLNDTRDAPVWGSEEVAEYRQYQYRVRDYAWALLVAIRGERLTVPTDPAARDRLIAELLR
jgi:hypothetical protein